MRALPSLLARGRQIASEPKRRRQLQRAVIYLLVIAAVAFVVAAALRDAGPESLPVLQPQLPHEAEPSADSPAEEAADRDQADLAPWDRARKRPDAQLLIPRRIHHFFSNSVTIPVRLVPEINSWSNNHKDYEIYYWDAGYVEQSLLTQPEYAGYSRYYWNGTQSRFERDLVARLVILHRFGGIAPDLNMRSLRESTEYLTDSSCVVAQDRVEKAVFSQGLEALPSLAFVACRPGHHFIAYLLRKVTEVPFRTGAVVLDVETSAFLVHAFNAAVGAFDEECATRACDFRERVSLAEPKVFMPVMEAGLYETMASNCKTRARMQFLQKEACYNLDANGNQPTAISLATPVYIEAWAPNKDRPALPLAKIGPSAIGRRPTKNWSLIRSSRETPVT